MTIPRMTHAQENSTVLLSPVENPKPHDGAEALAGDGVPALVVGDGVPLVRRAAAVPAAAHRRRSSRRRPRAFSLFSSDSEIGRASCRERV